MLINLHNYLQVTIDIPAHMKQLQFQCLKLARIHQGNQNHGFGCPAFEIGTTWIFFLISSTTVLLFLQLARQHFVAFKFAGRKNGVFTSELFLTTGNYKLQEKLATLAKFAFGSHSFILLCSLVFLF